MDDEMNLDGAICSAVFDETLDMGIVGTSAGTLWYINWAERTSIRLVSGHVDQVNGIAVSPTQHFASCSQDGSLRVWSLEDREQILQFQVVEQACTCVAFMPQPDTNKRDKLPDIICGYSDGTVRMFDVNQVEMVLKMRPHATAVTAINASSDGMMILSGGDDGLIAVSSPTTGITVRVISDHKGAPIMNIDVTEAKDRDLPIHAPLLWLATSADRRVSIWSSDWSTDFCELVDWLSFPAPAFAPDGSVMPKGGQDFSMLPPSLAQFSPEEQDIVVYVGYGMQKNISFYSLSQRKVVRTATLTHWCSSLDLSPNSPLILLGSNERLLKLMDYHEGSFQDFVGHNDRVHFVKFSSNGKYVFSVCNAEVFVWEVAI